MLAAASLLPIHLILPIFPPQSIYHKIPNGFHPHLNSSSSASSMPAIFIIIALIVIKNALENTDVISKFTAVISKFTVISRFQCDFYRISSDFVISDGFLDFSMIS